MVCGNAQSPAITARMTTKRLSKEWCGNRKRCGFRRAILPALRRTHVHESPRRQHLCGRCRLGQSGKQVSKFFKAAQGAAHSILGTGRWRKYTRNHQVSLLEHDTSECKCDIRLCQFVRGRYSCRNQTAIHRCLWRYRRRVARNCAAAANTIAPANGRITPFPHCRALPLPAHL